MTLAERIAWCQQIAVQADEWTDCLNYAAELTGLLGEPLANSLVPHRRAYERGLQDRETLLRLEEHATDTLPHH